YGTANQTQMNAGVANNLYTTPLVVATYVHEQAITPLVEHTSRTDNPHNVNKNQVGLGLVENYPVASETIALAGESNEHYLTPALANLVVERWVGDTLDAHISDNAN